MRDLQERRKKCIFQQALRHERSHSATRKYKAKQKKSHQNPCDCTPTFLKFIFVLQHGLPSLFLSPIHPKTLEWAW